VDTVIVTVLPTQWPDAVPNTILIEDLWFDSLTNSLVIAWWVDTLTLLASPLQYGITLSLVEPNLALPQDWWFMPSNVHDTLRYPLGESIVFDTTYVVMLHMRRVDGTGYSPPTDSSTATVRTTGFSWQPVRYFASQQIVYAFNRSVMLRLPVPLTEWPAGATVDTLRVDESPALPAGTVPVSIAFGFDVGHASPPFELGIRYHPEEIPSGFAQADAMVYGDSTGTLLPDPTSVVDSLASVVWITVGGAPEGLYVVLVDTTSEGP
jgi:hypothetical protein